MFILGPGSLGPTFFNDISWGKERKKKEKKSYFYNVSLL